MKKQKESKITIFENHEIDILYDKDTNLADIRKKFFDAGYKETYNIEPEPEEKGNIFFTKKLVSNQ
mgnify:CR=1 FL=1